MPQNLLIFKSVKVYIVLFNSFLDFILPVGLQFSLDFTKEDYLFNRGIYLQYFWVYVSSLFLKTCHRQGRNQRIM